LAHQFSSPMLCSMTSGPGCCHSNCVSYSFDSLLCLRGLALGCTILEETYEDMVEGPHIFIVIQYTKLWYHLSYWVSAKSNTCIRSKFTCSWIFFTFSSFCLLKLRDVFKCFGIRIWASAYLMSSTDVKHWIEISQPSQPQRNLLFNLFDQISSFA
jgi:hypothetical protein